MDKQFDKLIMYVKDISESVRSIADSLKRNGEKVEKKKSYKDFYFSKSDEEE